MGWGLDFCGYLKPLRDNSWAWRVGRPHRFVTYSFDIQRRHICGKGTIYIIETVLMP